jgi:hypothetical protein
MIEEIFASALEAIAKLKLRADGLESELSDLSTELNSFEDEYAKQAKILQDQIDNTYLIIDKKIAEVIDSIPTAINGDNGIDGKDAVVDYESINTYINKTVNALPKAIDGVDGQRGAKGDKGDKGDDGVSPTIDYDAIKEFILSNIKTPKDGKDGVNATSIKDMYVKNYELYIEFEDGTTKSTKLPRQIVGSSGGTIITGGDSQYVDMELLFKSAYDTNYKQLTYTLGNITEINVWTNNTKSSLLFTKTISYLNGNITSISILDLTTAKNMTKNISYNIDNNITSISTSIA